MCADVDTKFSTELNLNNSGTINRISVTQLYVFDFSAKIESAFIGQTIRKESHKSFFFCNGIN